MHRHWGCMQLHKCAVLAQADNVARHGVLVLQVRSRAIAAEGGASDALAQSAELEQQLEATNEEVRCAIAPRCMQ